MKIPHSDSSCVGRIVRLIAIAYLLFHGAAAFAASGTWNVTGTGNWGTSGNWVSGVVPGSTSSTTNADLATFGNNSNNAATVLLSGTNYNVKSLTFTTGGYTIGSSTDTGSLLLTSAGTIQVSAAGTDGNAVTIDTPLVIENIASGTTGTYTFTDAGGTLDPLIFNGSITGAATSGTSTLTLSGSDLESNTINGAIGDGSGGGELAITVNSTSGVGTWVLNGTNTYSGATAINGATVLVGNNSALGSGTVTMGGNGILGASGTAPVSIANEVILPANNFAAVGAGNQNLTITGLVTSTQVELSVMGTGTTTFAGGFDINTNGAEQQYVYGSGNLVVDNFFTSGAGANSNFYYVGSPGGTMTLSGSINITGSGTISAIDSFGGTIIVTGSSVATTDYRAVGGAVEFPLQTTGTTTMAGTVQLGGGELDVLGAANGSSTLIVSKGITSAGYANGGGYSIILIDPNAANGGLGTTLSGSLGTLQTNSTLFIDLTGSTAAAPAILNLTNGTNPTTNSILADAVVEDGNGNIGFMSVTGGTGNYTVTPYSGATALGSGSNSSTTNFIVSNTSLTMSAGYSGTLNSLQIATPTASGTLDLGGGTMSLTSGGLLVTGSNAYTITDGTLRAVTSQLYIQQYGTGILTINSSLAALTGTSVLDLTVSGPGTTILSASQIFASTGTASAGDVTTIDQGTLEIESPTALSSGLVQLRGGVLQIYGGGTYTATVGAVNGDVDWTGSSSDSATGGGFAARGGALTVTLSVSGTADATVSWGSAATQNGFVGAGQTFVLGSTTADSQVNFTNPINLGTLLYDTRSIEVIGNASNPWLDVATLSGSIIGAGAGIYKYGSGILELTGSNTYTGPTVVAQGILEVDNATGSGNGTGAEGLALNSGAVLSGSGSVSGSVAVNSGTIWGVTFQSGTVNSSGTLTLNGPVSLTGTSTLAGNTTLNGATTFAGASTLTGTSTMNGAVTFTGAATQSGITTSNDTITVASGTLTLGGTANMEAGDLFVSSGATLGGGGTVNGTVSVTGGIINGSGLTISNGNSLNFSGSSILAGTTTTTGQINVFSGTLALSGTATVSSGLFVQGGATLAGYGTVNGTGTVFGALTPGAQLGNGVLTFSNGLTISNGAVLNYGLGSMGTDLVSVTGSLTLGTGITLNLAANGMIATGTAYDLINYTGLLSNSGNFTGWTVTGGPAGDSYAFSEVTVGGTNEITVTFSGTIAAANTTYTLMSSATNTNVLVSATAGISTAIANTGSSNSLAYTGLSGTAAGGATIGGASTSGTIAALASGTNGGLTFTVGAAGTYVVTPTVTSATDTTTGSSAIATGTTGLTITAYNRASLGAVQSGSNYSVSNLAGTYNAAAYVTSNSLSNAQSGFTNVSISGTQIDEGATSPTLATFNPTGLLNGTYSATEDINFNDVTASGSAIVGGAGDSTSVGVTATISGYSATSGTAQILAGGGYAGYGLIDSGSMGTNAVLLGGTAGATTTIKMDFSNPNNRPGAGGTGGTYVSSDVLTLTGINSTGVSQSGSKDGSLITDTFVLQLSYTSNAAVNAQGGQYYIGWFDTLVGGGTWVNAIAGNSNSVLPADYSAGTLAGPGSWVLGDEFNGSYATFVTDYGAYALTLGVYGFDSTDNQAWAVLDHNSDFAVIPEPSTWAMIVGGFGMLLGIQRLRRRRVGT